jgi:hypothetical protein
MSVESSGPTSRQGKCRLLELFYHVHSLCHSDNPDKLTIRDIVSTSKVARIVGTLRNRLCYDIVTGAVNPYSPPSVRYQHTKQLFEEAIATMDGHLESMCLTS